MVIIPIPSPFPVGGSSSGGPPLTTKEALTGVVIVISIFLLIGLLLVNLLPLSGRPQETEGKIVQVLPSSKGHLYRDLIIEIDGVNYPSSSPVSDRNCQLGKVAWGFIDTYWSSVPAWTKIKIDVRYCKDPR
jgi:hypothetical protein